MKKSLYTFIVFLFCFYSLKAQEETTRGTSTSPRNAEIVVGAIGSTVDVSALGGATYTIPIQVPQGLGGIQPNLAISYNNQGGNGLLGWCWDLQGISCITRLGTTLYHDGRMSGVDFYDDRFALDGQRLICLSGNYGENGSEYRTEIDNMAKIKAYTCDTTNGPAYFKVWLPNGNIAYYGNSADSRIGFKQHHDVCMWLLNRVEDRNGNYMTYEYMNGNTTFWLERVRYAGNANANIACSYSVLFHYSPRTDQERTFIGNNTFDHKRILDSITVKRSNTELYKYKFHFLAPNYSNGYYYHYLNQIDFSCGNKNYKPTTIVWNNNDYANTTTNCTHSIRLSNGTTPNYLDKTKFTGDFNGDGYTDFLLYYIDESNHKRASYHINKGLLNGQQVFQKLTTLTLDDNIDWIYVADLNGDGLDDIILSMRQDVFLFEDKVNIDAYITSIDANGNLSFNIADKDYGEFRIRSKYTESLQVGDFLGEGKQSLLVQECDLSKTGPRLFYITYTNNRLSSTQLPSEMVLDVDRMFACDFNGDGISEIYYSDADSVITGLKRLRRNNNGFYYEQVNNSMLSPWHQLFQGDFNGDGKVDLLTYTEDVLGNGNWYIQYFKETTLEWPAYSFSTNTMGIGNPGNHLCSFEYMTAPTYNYISVGDFNGDGKSDIAVRTSDDKMRFLYAPIRKVNDVAQFASVQNVNLSDMGLSDASDQSICIGNFLGHENLSFFSSQTLYSLHPLTNRYSVSTITDGMGNCSGFQYDYLMPILSGASVSAFYKRTRQTSAQQQMGMFTVSLPIKALSCLTTSNTNCPNREDEVFYSYQNALVHKLGRGFLGFEASKTETMQGGTPWQTTERYYGQCSPFTTPYLGLDTVVVKNDRGETVSSTEYTNKILYKQYQSNYNKKIFIPIVAKQVSDNYKLENTSEFLKKVIVENTYNDEVVNIGGETFRSYVILKQTDTKQGTDARSTVNSVDLCEFQSIKHTEYVNETQPLIVSWVINRPSKVLETSRRLGGYDDKKSLTVYSFPQGLGSHLFLPDTVTYYPSGIESPLDTLATRDVFVYHQTGSVEEKHHRDLAQNLPLQSSYYEYSSSGRFLTKKTNTAGYETNYEYNYNYGFLNKETDCNGLITRYVTTPLGDSSSVYYPNGTITNSGTSWVDRNDTNAPDDALYYKWEKSTGKGEKRTYFDATGAKLRTVTPGMTTELVYNDFLYNERGLLVCESLPYFGTDANAQIYWTRHEYDNYNRLMVTHYPDGLAESYLHHGLTTDHVYWTDPYVPSSTSTTTNVVGWTVESRDEDWNVVQYDYNADGTLKWTQIGDDVNTKVKVDYDDAGNRILIVDPDYGSTESLFNAYGQLVRTQTPKGNYTVYEYDSLGRLINRYEHDVESNKVDSTIYEYCAHPGKLGLLSLISFNGKKQNITYSYDIVNRLNFISELRYDKYYNTSYTYDFASRVTSVTYPTGFQIKKGYTPTGHLSILTDANNLVMWRTLGKTAAGQIESYVTGDGLVTNRNYEPETGRLKEILTLNGNDTIQFNSYSYDLIANLAARIDHVHGMNEEFIYDRLNRLTGIVEGNDTTAHFAYDAYGRMLSKRFHSSMVFDSASYNASNRPHAISQARTAEDLPLKRLSYTHFDKLSRLRQDTLALDYTYGFEHQRLHMTEATIYGDTLREKEYAGNCEFIDNGLCTTTLTYLTGPLGVFGSCQIVDGGRPNLFFVHPDHLGSWNLVTDRYANIVQDVTFDAWGTPFQFGANGLEPADTLLFDRGFTGHEHMTGFGLINMNGRCYDPFTSSFLSVDNYVQNPDYTQSFNRYAYCLNNPLKYTDPEGEFFVLDSWLSGFFQGYFSTDVNKFSSGWEKGKQLAQNDKKIWGGLFQTDSNKGFFGKSWELISRVTWQLPQTILGFGFTQISNLGGQVDNVDYYGGATVSSGNFFGSGNAVTLGSYINGSHDLSADPNNSDFQHEYGHYLQSQEMGFAYLNRVGLPSLLSFHDHRFHPIEQDANRRAFLYFNKFVEGFYKSEEDVKNDYGWDFYNNPLNINNTHTYGQYVDYYNSNSLELLNGMTIHAKWYDYLFWRKTPYGPILSGLINAIYYNCQY